MAPRPPEGSASSVDKAPPAPRASPDVGAAKSAIRRTRVGGPAKNGRPEDGIEVSDDDDVVDDSTLTSHELLARELGAEVIEDIRDDVS